jgi:isoleucyl-tRNA synthetase
MVPPVVLQERGEPGLGVEVHRAAGVRCERCWLVLPDVGARKSHPDLCARCTEAVAAISEVAPAG